MSRGLSQDVVDILSSRQFITAELVEINLDTPLFFSSAQFDIETSTGTSNGTQTYIAQGSFIAYSGVREIDEVRVNNINITFSGATQAFLNIALNDNYLHKEFRIYKVFFNSADMQLLTDPILIYDGEIIGASVEESVDESIVTLQSANQFYDFERVAGRRSNNGSQQRFFPGDKGMQFSTKAIQDIRWGRAS